MAACSGVSMRRVCVVLSGACPSTKPAATDAACPRHEGRGRRGSVSATTAPRTMKPHKCFLFLILLRLNDSVLTFFFLIAGHRPVAYGAVTMLKPLAYRKHLPNEPHVLVPLRQHCYRMPVIFYFTPPGAWLGSQLPSYALLAEPAQSVVRGVLAILNDLMDSGMCFTYLRDDMFEYDVSQGTVKLAGTRNYTFASLDPYLVDWNCRQIADLLEAVLFNQNGIPVNSVEEVASGLLPMLRCGGMSMWYAAYNHSSLVPLVNRLDLFVRLFRQLTDIVQVRCPREYVAILQNLVFPQDWHSIIETNSWLLHWYCGGVYNSRDPSRERQAELFIRYLRNSETHGMQRAEARISRIDLAKIHYALGTMILHSLQQGLQTYGWLKSTDIHSLFKYSV